MDNNIETESTAGTSQLIPTKRRSPDNELNERITKGTAYTEEQESNKEIAAINEESPESKVNGGTKSPEKNGIMESNSKNIMAPVGMSPTINGGEAVTENKSMEPTESLMNPEVGTEEQTNGICCVRGERECSGHSGHEVCEVNNEVNATIEHEITEEERIGERTGERIGERIGERTGERIGERIGERTGERTPVDPAIEQTTECSMTTTTQPPECSMTTTTQPPETTEYSISMNSVPPSLTPYTPTHELFPKMKPPGVPGNPTGYPTGYANPINPMNPTPRPQNPTPSTQKLTGSNISKFSNPILPPYHQPAPYVPPPLPPGILRVEPIRTNELGSASDLRRYNGRGPILEFNLPHLEKELHLTAHWWHRVGQMVKTRVRYDELEGMFMRWLYDEINTKQNEVTEEELHRRSRLALPHLLEKHFKFWYEAFKKRFRVYKKYKTDNIYLRYADSSMEAIEKERYRVDFCIPLKLRLPEN